MSALTVALLAEHAAVVVNKLVVRKHLVAAVALGLLVVGHTTLLAHNLIAHAIP